MKHIKSYTQVNEELTRKQRMLVQMPYLLPAILIEHLTGLPTLLNYKWSEIKKKTTDSKFDPIFSMYSHEIGRMDRQIKKITLEDIPKHKLGLATFLRTWNLYLVEGDTHTDSSSKDPRKKRPIVYLSKDEIKTGDYFCGERISDSQIYVDFKAEDPVDLRSYPIIEMIAKADNAEETIDMTKYIEDLCIEIKDDLPVEVKINFNKIGDILYVSLSPDESGVNLYFSTELNKKIENLKMTIESFLHTQKYNLKGKVYYYLPDPLRYKQFRFYYFGNAGRFPEIRKFGKIEDKANIYSNDESMRHVSDTEGINLQMVSQRGSLFLNKRQSKELGTDRYNFYIDADDLITVMSDRKNCSNNPNNPNGEFNSKDGQNIQLRTISLEFKK